MVSITSNGRMTASIINQRVVLMVVAMWAILNTSTSMAFAGTKFGDQAPPSLFPARQSKMLNFFLHDDLMIGQNSSAITVLLPVAGFNSTSLQNQSFFGSTVVLDDAITLGADPNSLELGRGRGFYVWDAMNITGPGIEFIFTAVFNEASGYGGSTLSFQGHDVVVDPVRELSISGGTGEFRLARGWAVITTYTLIGGAANLNITVYVFTGC